MCFLSDVIQTRGHDGGETGEEVPEDVAMEEPGTRVGGRESHDSSGRSNTSDITFNGVGSVDFFRAVRLDEPEVVSMQMERMSFIVYTGREDDLNDLVSGEDERVFGDVEVVGTVGTLKNLDKSGSLRSEVGDVVDVPLSFSSGDDKVKSDVDIWFRSSGSDQRTKVGFNEGVQFCTSRAKRHRGSGFFSWSSCVAQDGTREGRVLVQISGWVTADEWSVDPVVGHGLVRSHDDGIPLTSKHVDRVDGHGRCGIAVGFNDGHVVAVNGDGEDVSCRSVDDTETVAFALHNIDNVERNLGSALESSSTVECTTVGDRDNTSGDIASKQWDSCVVPPVTNLPDRVHVINIIEVFERILGVVNDQCSSESINILYTQLTVVPVGSDLIVDEWYLIRIAGLRRDRAGRHEGTSFVERIGCANEDSIEIEGGTTTHGGVIKTVVNRHNEGIPLFSR